MAGGKGTRLRMGEKPLAPILGRPLIDYVTSALDSSERIFVAVTDDAPGTRRWAEKRGFSVVNTPGEGFVPDMVHAVEQAGISGPVLIAMADLPLITPELIDDIVKVYRSRPEPALSTHTPLSLHRKLGRRPDSLFNYKGDLIVPAGINILDGALIRYEQEDHHLILERIELAINVNTPEDLRLCERVIQGGIV